MALFILNVNDDDDNYNDEVDFVDSGFVDNDLIKLKILEKSPLLLDPLSGFFTLVYDDTKIKVWHKNNKTTPSNHAQAIVLSGVTTFDIRDTGEDLITWIEGIVPSNSVVDLYWHSNGATTGVWYDSVKIVVMEGCPIFGTSSGSLNMSYTPLNSPAYCQTPPAGAGVPRVQERYFADATTWHEEFEPVLWTHNSHRWATVVANGAMHKIKELKFVASPYDPSATPNHNFDPNNPYALPNVVFATSIGVIPREGVPPLGDWNVYVVAELKNGTRKVSPHARRTSVNEVVSTKWEGVVKNDGETNLTKDVFISNFAGSIASGRRGDLLYPERNHPEGTAGKDDNHNAVDAHVEINPAIPQDLTAKLHLAVDDPDHYASGGKDPDGDTIRANHPWDNVMPVHANGSLVTNRNNQNGRALLVIPLAGGVKMANTRLPIGWPQPGNDFIATVHDEKGFFDAVDFDSQFGTFVERTGDMGISMTIKFAFPNLQTRVLYLARTLWIEFEQMAAPAVTDGPFDGDTNCNGCDDPRTRPKMPDTSFLENTLKPTLIRVRSLPAVYNDNNGLGDVPFEFEPANDMAQQAHYRRDVLSKPDYWTIQLVGAYEYDQWNDHDPEIYNYFMGYAFPNDRPTLVFFETIRDKYANIDGNWVGDPLRDQLTYEAIVAAHECFHRFFGDHGTPLSDDGIMTREAHDTRVPVELTDEQFRALLRTYWPR